MTTNTPVEQRQYKDVSGSPCSLSWLVRNEPEWAVNQIRHRDRLERELKDAKDEIATLRQNRDDWRRCAEMLKAVLLMERYPEVGDNCESRRNNADQLFSILSEKGN